MGELILCVGKRAEQPFVFAGTHTELYTIEEVCYYVYTYIDTLTDEAFDENLSEWLCEEAGLLGVSQKMKRLVGRRHSMKDKAVTLLCACDYYKEKEIHDLIKRIDRLEKMSFFERCQKKAKGLLESGSFQQAEQFLMEILKSGEAAKFTAVEYGDMLHNLAVTHIHTASYMDAAGEFKRAYENNQRMETLKQYLLVLKLSEQKELYQKELAALNVDASLSKLVCEELSKKKEEARLLLEYKQIEEFSFLRQEGKISAYYEGVEQLIEKWKQEYREEAAG